MSDCGCQVKLKYKDGENTIGVNIIHCTVHEAAPEMLKLLEEIYDDPPTDCPFCGMYFKDFHDPDCRLISLLDKIKGE